MKKEDGSDVYKFLFSFSKKKRGCIVFSMLQEKHIKHLKFFRVALYSSLDHHLLALVMGMIDYRLA